MLFEFTAVNNSPRGWPESAIPCLAFLHDRVSYLKLPDRICSQVSEEASGGLVYGEVTRVGEELLQACHVSVSHT